MFSCPRLELPAAVSLSVKQLITQPSGAMVKNK